MKGVKLIFKDYSPYLQNWNHDHCEFCGMNFSEFGSDLKKGYTTDDDYRYENEFGEPLFLEVWVAFAHEISH